METNQASLAPCIRIPTDTPPVFRVHAADDPVAGAENSLVMYSALRRVNVPAELHLYASGGHGFGVRQRNLACSSWTDRCLDWLRDQGLLGPRSTAQ